MSVIKRVWDFSRQVLSLTEDVQEAKTDIRELREALRDIQLDFESLQSKFVDLTHVVEKMALQMLHEREVAERDRRELMLRLEMTLERFERRLPPAQ